MLYNVGYNWRTWSSEKKQTRDFPKLSLWFSEHFVTSRPMSCLSEQDSCVQTEANTYLSLLVACGSDILESAFLDNFHTLIFLINLEVPVLRVVS